MNRRITNILRALALVGVVSTGSAQITQLNLDLRNTYSLFQTDQLDGAMNLRNYGQYYVLGVRGYAFDERLLDFSVQTSLTSSSSRNSSPLAEQYLQNRNLGYYNFTVTAFPGVSMPITVYGSRYDQLNSASTNAVGYYPPLGETKNAVEKLGLRWHIAKNSVPQTELTLERTREKGTTFGLPVDQTSDVLGLRLSNSDASGTTGYALQYTGNRIYGVVPGGERTIHEFQLYANTKVSAQADAYANANYGIRDQFRSRTFEAGGTYRASDMLRYRLSVTNTENRYSSIKDYQGSTYAVNQEVDITASSHVQGNIGAHYLRYENVYAASKFENDRGSIINRWNFMNQVGTVRLNASASADLGFESYTSEGRKFIQQSQAMVGATSRLTERFDAGVSHTFSLFTTYYFGNSIENSTRITLATSALPRTIIEVEGTRSDRRYLTEGVLPPVVTYLAGAKSTHRLTNSTVIDVQYQGTWMNSWYRERLTRFSAGLTDGGLVKNVVVQIRGEHVYSDFTRFAMIRIEGSADYQFYAFALGARYLLYSYGGVKTNGVMFEIRRPFSFDLR